MGRKAVTELLETCKAAAHRADNETDRARLVQSMEEWEREREREREREVWREVIKIGVLLYLFVCIFYFLRFFLWVIL